MTSSHRPTVALSVLAAAMSLAVPAVAQDTKPPKQNTAAPKVQAIETPGGANVPLKIAIVDVREVTRRSAMTKDIARQIDAKRKSLRDEIQKEEQALRKTDEELKKQKVLLSPAAFEEERKKFETRVREMQRKVQDSNIQLGRMRSLGERDFEVQLSKALVALASERGYTLILRKREIMIAAEALDITKEVIEKIDKAVPKYKIPDRPKKSGQ
jgi:outer membrane protein